MTKAILVLHKARSGVGGFFCPCCNPAYGRLRGPDSKKHRRAVNRALRRLRRQMTRNKFWDEWVALCNDRRAEWEQSNFDLALWDWVRIDAI